jgi:hypothetical protein
MPKNQEDNRVLSRLHGRELSAAEYGQVSGGFIIHTRPCTFDAKTCTMDGDCEETPC